MYKANTGFAAIKQVIKDLKDTGLIEPADNIGQARICFRLSDEGFLFAPKAIEVRDRLNGKK